MCLLLVSVRLLNDTRFSHADYVESQDGHHTRAGVLDRSLFAKTWMYGIWCDLSLAYVD